MTQISDFKILYCVGINKLKPQHDYSNYLIVLKKTKEGEGIWYQFRNETESGDFYKYMMEKLEIQDEKLAEQLLDSFNDAVTNKTYDIINLVKIRRNKYKDTAFTDKGIILNTFYEWKKEKKR